MRERSLEYQPALDGVRGMAVLLVVVFHLGVDAVPAGYLGVSVFFTLSGYLITALLLAELDSTGAVSFPRFYARRARRLLPASLLVLLGVVAARLAGEFRLVPGLRADLLGALLQVFNWVQLAGGSSYTMLFDRSSLFVSPMEHYWSLAIEEQFYLVWPVTLVALFRWRARRGRGLLAPVVVLAAAFAVAAPLIGWWFGPDAAYWATPARLPELLVGAALAVALRRRPVTAPRCSWLVAPAVLAIVGCSMWFPSGSGPAFSGWLTPFALVSAALILGLQVPGRGRAVLSWTPLVAVGTVSYGLYLVHWPVFVVLRQHGWDLATWGGAALALSLTGAITVASYLLVEQPVRAAGWSPRRTGRLAAAGSVAALVAVLAVPVPRGFLEADHEVLAAASADTGVPTETLARVTTAPTSTAVPTTDAPVTTVVVPVTTVAPTTTAGEVVLPLPATPNRPVRLLTVGDSTAFYVGQALAQWAVDHPDLARSDLLWCQGCGFLLDGEITGFDGRQFLEQSVEVVERRLPEFVRRSPPDVVVLMTTVDDVADRRWTDAEGVLTPRDPAFRARLKEQYAALTASLVDAGVPLVVWVVPPVPHTLFESPDLAEPDRYLIQHDVIREVVDEAASAGAGVRVNDMAGWLSAAGHDDDSMWRPDGTHFSEESARWLVERWLGPWLVNAAVSG